MSESKHSVQKVGLSPGTVVYTGEHTNPIDVRLFIFKDGVPQEEKLEGPNRIERLEKTITNFHSAHPEISSEAPFHHGEFLWISILGLSDIKFIEELGRIFNLNTLMLEDIVNVGQRPKFEELGDCCHAIFKEISYQCPDEKKTGDGVGLIEVRQVSLVLKEKILITFKEGHSFVFKKMLERLQAPRQKPRKMSVEKLFHLVLDCIIDQYFVVTNKLDDQPYDLEENMGKRSERKYFLARSRKKTNSMLFHLYEQKKMAHTLQRHVTPLRELILNSLQSDFFDEDLRPYLNDVRDHIYQINDDIKSILERNNSIVEFILSINSFKLNEVIRTLTVFTAIFMPITFMTSVYGMNFSWMPFLNHEYGFFIIAGTIFTTLVLQVTIFRKKNWID